MLLDRFAGNGKAEAGTGRFCREVWIKNPRQQLLRYAGPVVLDRHHDFGINGVAAEPDFATRGGLESVLDQIGDGTAKHARVTGEMCRRGRLDVGAEVDAALTAAGVARGD